MKPNKKILKIEDARVLHFSLMRSGPINPKTTAKKASLGEE